MMDPIYDFGAEFAETYSEKCKQCGKEVEVSTQKDDRPEYYTEIFVRCPCGESVCFHLPVN